MNEKSIWLIKRDFRLFDNEALYSACKESREVLPVYCFEDIVFTGPDWGKFHSYAVKSALAALRKNLRHHSSDVYICHGDLLQQLQKLKKHYDFSSIYIHEETGLNHTFERDKVLLAWCDGQGIVCKEYVTNGVIRKLRSRDDWEYLFKSYIEQPLIQIPDIPKLQMAVADLACQTKLPTNVQLGTQGLSQRLPKITERTAHQTLQAFLNRAGYKYRGGISTMSTAPDRCSRLSYDLAWGTLSLRTVMKRTQTRRDSLPFSADRDLWERSLRAFKSRLYWHAHFIQKLETEVKMEFDPQNKVYKDTLPVVEGDELRSRLLAWKTGTTGFPAIDAAMRYYRKNGWLNFRSRAMIVSFACHALRIPWQIIIYELAPFMMDYVPGIHVAQIQMQAGVTGTNVIRVYSPMKQMEEKDPEATFIRSHVSELKRFNANQIGQFQSQDLGSYPKPIIDFACETKIMKDSLYGLKKTAVGKIESDRVYKLHGSRSRTNRQ